MSLLYNTVQFSCLLFLMCVSSKEPGAHKFYMARDEDSHPDHDKCGEANKFVQQNQSIIYLELDAQVFTVI